MDAICRFRLLSCFSILFFIIVVAYQLNAMTEQTIYVSQYLEPQRVGSQSTHVKVFDNTNETIVSQNLETQRVGSQSNHVKVFDNTNATIPRQAFNPSNNETPNSIPIIYIITPTYARLEQKADLTRMSQTLKLVKSIHWIIVEDSPGKTALVTMFLKHSGLSYTHLYATDRSAVSKGRKKKLRGVEQRNAGLNWLRTDPYPATHKGVVYMADDDNTYDIRIFEEMRYTTKASVWPVGLAGRLRYESPIVEANKVVGWLAWSPDRTFALDMAGFAVNLQMVLDYPNAGFTNNVEPGKLETYFLNSFSILLEDLEPKADGCTKILVWHTKTQSPSISRIDERRNIYIKSGVANRSQVIKRIKSGNYEI